MWCAAPPAAPLLASICGVITTGRPLSWEEYASSPEQPRAEYIDGQLIVSPGLTGQHQSVTLELVALLEPVLPSPLEVIFAWAWKTAEDEFIPDVMVYDRTGVLGQDVRFTGTPHLVVEVLSLNRGDDLLRKMAKYAAAGLPRYWIADPRAETLTTYVSLDGLFVPTAVHGRGEIPELDLGVATVQVDVAALLG